MTTYVKCVIIWGFIVKWFKKRKKRLIKPFGKFGSIVIFLKSYST